MIFGSDNQSGASQQVIETLLEANQGFTHGYGDDEWTERAVDELRAVFDCDLDAYFVTTGTASNCLALACLTKPWEVILCHPNSHILNDESTAPKLLTGGARMVPISRDAGKITAGSLKQYLATAGSEVPHNSQAGALSITQCNETGLVYSPGEIKAISGICRNKGLGFHMDGARFANALAALGCTPAEMTWKSGIDVLSLGATKCGALCAEAVVFFNQEYATDCIHRRKRSAHVVSKGRLFGAQFCGWLRDGHWLELAEHANSQAAQLAAAISDFEEMQIVWPVEANQIFVTIPGTLAESLQQAGAEFYEWPVDALPDDTQLNEGDILVRLVTSFLTQNKHCDVFIRHITEYCSE